MQCVVLVLSLKPITDLLTATQCALLQRTCSRLRRPPAAILYAILNKPRKVTTTTARGPTDKKGPIVTEFLPIGCPRISPAGRLDYESEGLIVMTNDSRVSRMVTTPGAMQKTYRVLVQSRCYPYKQDLPTQQQMDQMVHRGAVSHKQGQLLCAAAVRLVDSHLGRALLDLDLNEGKKHEVRRIVSAAGFSTLQLLRIRIGPIAHCVQAPTTVLHALAQLQAAFPAVEKLGDIYALPATESVGTPCVFGNADELLEPGQARLLTPAEVGAIFAECLKKDIE